MELEIGMSRAGFRKLAKEILSACDSPDTIEVTRYIEPNANDGSTLTLSFNNMDMENRDDVDANTGLWDMTREDA
jgi:hypothetical protein